MLKSFTLPICLAVGLTTAANQTEAQVIREGARRTGGAVVQSGRAVAQGTRDAVNRAGQATRNAIDNTTNAARAQVDRLQPNELQSGAVNNTINTDVQGDTAPIQTQADLNSNQRFDSSAQAPVAGNSVVAPIQDQYQSGYRGLNGEAAQPKQANYQGRVYQLRHDRQGREFICINGRAVYFDDQQAGQPQGHQAYKLNDVQMVNQNQANRQSQQGWPNDQAAPPAPPTPIRSDLNSAAPAGPSLNVDTNISAEQRTQLNESAEVDSNANINSSATSDSSANVGSAQDSNNPSSNDAGKLNK